MSIFARTDFWIASLERALKTAAQAAIATIGTDAVGVTELDWTGVGGVVVRWCADPMIHFLALDHPHDCVNRYYVAKLTRTVG